MKKKLANAIVRARILIVVLAIILTVVCALQIGKTNINYDFTQYLGRDTMTRQSLEIMQDEFGSVNQLRLMFEDLPEGKMPEILGKINSMDGVQIATHDETSGTRTVDGTCYQLITVTAGEGDVHALVETLRSAFTDVGSYTVAGGAADSYDLQLNVASEIPVAMLVAVVIILVVLFLTSHAWLEPILFTIVLAVAIAINMGTNWIFDSISFVTFAVAAILQLALSMDYAIMLLHAYNSLRDEGMSDVEAVTEALCRSFMPVSSSALTTVAGLVSLLFMSFTIGFDIGIVLSKGILISMLTVFTLLPALILLCAGPLRRSAHKPLPLGGAGIARISWAMRRVLPILMTAVIIFACALQTQNTYSFGDSGTSSAGSRVSEIFGEENLLIVLFPRGDEDADYDAQRQFAAEVESITVDGRNTIANVQGMVTTGALALEYLSADDVAEMLGVQPFLVNLFFQQSGFGEAVRADKLLAAAQALMPENETIDNLASLLTLADQSFNGPSYSRMLLSLDVENSAAAYETIDKVLVAARAAFGEDIGITGTAMSSYDISHAFGGDLQRVNIITVVSLLLIIALSFRSFSIPLILVLVIQGAVWITMAVSRLAGESVFFISYLICLAIQMGTTIDYGILITSHYREYRAALQPAQALREAMQCSIATIFTSGIILICAGYTVGKVCSIYYISSIGLLLARGAIVSVLLILFLLSALLVLFDRRIVKQR